MRTVLHSIVVLVILAVTLRAQAVAFDAASVKVNRSGSNDSSMSVPPGGTMTATNITLARLIPNAFDMPPIQITGGPAWLATDRFDIVARPPADAKPDDLPAMLQALLAERFALRTHRERQERPVYALVVLASGKLGPALAPAAVDCVALIAQKRITPECSSSMGIGRAGGSLNIKGQPLARLVSVFGNVLDRVAVDQTGLMGNFDLELKWSAGDATATSNDPVIFSAVREQLGLQLMPATAPIEMLVIDSVERPTAD